MELVVMTRNESNSRQDSPKYDSQMKSKHMASLRMSTCVSPGLLPGCVTVKDSIKNPLDSPLSSAVVHPPIGQERQINKQGTIPRSDALEALSKKVSDKSVWQHFKSADTAYMLATGDIFTKSANIFSSSQRQLNEIPSVAATYKDSNIQRNHPSTLAKRSMNFNNILQDIAVSSAMPRSKQLISTQISVLDMQSKTHTSGLNRNYSTQTPRGNFSRSLLSNRESDYNGYSSSYQSQRMIVSPRYTLAFKTGTRLPIYNDERVCRKFKGSVRRPKSRNRSLLQKSQPCEFPEKGIMKNELAHDERNLKAAYQQSATKPNESDTSISGVSRPLQELGLASKKGLENDTQGMKVTGVTGVALQSLSSNKINEMGATSKSSQPPTGVLVNKEEKNWISRDTPTGLPLKIPSYSDDYQDEESASVITQGTGFFENDDTFEQVMEAEGEDEAGYQEDYCPDDNDIDCADDTAISCLEDDNTAEAEEIDTSNMARASSQLSTGDNLDGIQSKPAIIKSTFSNCPPVINFGTKHEKVDPLPSHIKKLLRWKMSPITPIVVRNTIARSGFKPSKKSHDWIGYFGKHMKASGFRSLREYQKINHFPGSFQLGRKDRLWRNLSRMQAKFGKKEFGFVPQSFILPWDKKLLKSAWEEGSSKQKYIIKPPASARGIGIRLVHKWNQIPTKKPVLVQKYLSRPLLLNGFKFDIRLYVYVTSFDPLRIYLFDDGLVRFATTKYSMSMKHLSNRYMHLTNYSINKNSGDFQQNDDVNICQGHKWSVKALWRHLQEKGVNTDKIWHQLKDIVIKTLISVEQFTNSLVKANCRRKSCCHELFGFDIMLDDRYQPWILEVNISPSLHSNSPLDVEIKGQMVSDMFNIAGFQLPDKRQIMANSPSPNSSTTSTSTGSTFSQDKRKESLEVTCDTRAKHTYFARHYKQFVESELMMMMLDILTVNDIQMLVESEDENSRRGHFQRIYPGGEETRKYVHFFEQPRYYNTLLHMWELKYENQKLKATLLLESFCRRGLHLLSNPALSARTIPMEHVWTMSRHNKILASPRTDPKYLPIVLKSSASLSSLCSSTNSTAMVPFPGRVSSAGRWEISSTKTQNSASPIDVKLLSSRSTK